MLLSEFSMKSEILDQLAKSTKKPNLNSSIIRINEAARRIQNAYRYFKISKKM